LEFAFSGKYYLKEKFIFDFNMKLGFMSWAYVPYLNTDISAEEKIVYHSEKMKPILKSEQSDIRLIQLLLRERIRSLKRTIRG
jgi:hypothetical protein